MLHQVSWISFILFLFTITSIYYFGILVLFYRYDILALLKAKANTTLRTDQVRMANNSIENTKTEYTDISNQASNLMSELKKIAGIASEEAYPKEELVMALQLVLKRYPQLRESKFRPDINDHIALLCKETCSISLSEDEQRMH